MSFQDWVKSLTTEFVEFMNTPRDERRHRKKTRKEQRGKLSQHWFGIIPIALFMVFRSFLKKGKSSQY